MIEPVSWLTVIGLSLTAFIIILQKWTKKNDEKSQKISQIDKDIDNANDAHSLVNLFNRLRDR